MEPAGNTQTAPVAYAPSSQGSNIYNDGMQNAGLSEELSKVQNAVGYAMAAAKAYKVQF